MQPSTTCSGRIAPDDASRKIASTTGAIPSASTIFLKKPDRHQHEALAHVVAVEPPRPLELGQERARALDRARDELREEADEGGDVEQRAARWDLPAVDVDRVGERLERVERDAHRQHDVQQVRPPAERVPDRQRALDEEVVVLEDAEQPDLRGEREHDPGLPRPMVFARLQLGAAARNLPAALARGGIRSATHQSTAIEKPSSAGSADPTSRRTRATRRAAARSAASSRAAASRASRPAAGTPRTRRCGRARPLLSLDPAEPLELGLHRARDLRVPERARVRVPGHLEQRIGIGDSR